MATTPNGYGRFIGRVGGLAVALGIGVAIANGAAIASADDGESTSGESSSSESSSGASSAAQPDTPDTVSSTSSTNDDDPESDTTTPKSTVSAQTVTKTIDEPKGKTDSATGPEDDNDTPAEPLAVLSVAATARRAQAEATPTTTPTAAVTQSAVADQSLATTAVSPLGTPEQLAAERLATETVNTLPVVLMKLFLRQGFLSAAQQQFPGGPDEENVAALNRAVDEYALAAAFQQQLLNPLTPTVITQVAPPHTWYGQSVGGTRILYDNPDTIYRFMGVSASSQYVITGRFSDLTENGRPADTSFSVLEGLAGTTSSILTADDLEINEDGTFVITVSSEPANGRRNHIQLTSSSTIIAARDTLGDWNAEEPISLAIERVGGPPNSLFAQLGGFALLGPLVSTNPLLTALVSLIPPLPCMPPVIRGTFTAAILAIRGVSEQSKYMALATTDPETGAPRTANEISQPSSNAEFLANQLQSHGYYELEDNQVIVLTIDPGDANYFIVPTYNDWTITDNYWDQPTSLNNEQAKRNSDGTYTLVISPTDPGAANWVSTGGLNQGTISIRFQDLGPDPQNLPRIVDQRVMTHEELQSYLPADDFITEQQRADQIALRKAGFNKRWAPFPQP
ncbi:DUF1214 domain-containing protein [Mycobacterium sp.]|uniref:DUF1214 domain-containing protein n=1 Tax=Mycobacterium sp. TaxID=1785 RepID=UPI002D832B25|nr:DUF1214 domain-containing protein [Mycobacterium sp.]